jgi:hypothetical protein
MVASAFLYAIGGKNYSSLKCISLPLSFEHTNIGGSRAVGAMVPALGTRAHLRIAKRIPFDVPDHWTFPLSFIYIYTALARDCTDLRLLNLILPSWLDTSQTNQASKQVGIIRLHNLQRQTAQTQSRLKESMKIRIIKVKKRWTVFSATASAQNATPAVMVQEFVDQGWQAI